MHCVSQKDFTFESHVTSPLISEDVFEMHLDSDAPRASTLSDHYRPRT